ncbi:MAG: type II secretion system inner membrane protein GspF [Gammaproteobacteria bacterium]|nr:type II secretion system inner membrane protein GspF [Gammaproteobacteria bacterium]
MGAFEYTALDAQGKERKGVREADTARQVRAALREQGLTPLTVEEVREREVRKQKQFALFQGISAADLALITRQLATLVQSGLPLAESLQAVSQQTHKPRLRNMVMGVRSRVLEGHSLATALGDYPHVFSELFRSTVQAGEHSGHLSVVLERLADYTESRQAMNNKLMLALLYPVLITIVAVVVVVLLVTYVVPQVVQMFDHIGQELPLLTRGLIAVSAFTSSYGLLVALAILLGVLAFSYMMRVEHFRRRVHAFLLTMPLIGKLVRGMNTARFARTFSILTASGVPVLEAMRIAAQVMINIPMRESVQDAARRVREGTSISTALAAGGYFPPMTIHLIGSGESSGKLEQMLERAAHTQEKEVETFVAALMGIFEPLMILTMGVIVLIIVLAIITPILDMNTLVH